MEVRFSEKKNVCFDAKFLDCEIEPRNYEDVLLTIDGCEFQDDENNPKMPCMVAKNNTYLWCPTIDVNDGRIINWDTCRGVSAKVFYKVCDQGAYTVRGNEQSYTVKSYVPDCLSINDEGYGDYVLLSIDKNGFIEDWEFNDKLMANLLKGDFQHGDMFDEYQEKTR